MASDDGSITIGGGPPPERTFKVLAQEGDARLVSLTTKFSKTALRDAEQTTTWFVEVKHHYSLSALDQDVWVTVFKCAMAGTRAYRVEDIGSRFEDAVHQLHRGAAVAFLTSLAGKGLL